MLLLVDPNIFCSFRLVFSRRSTSKNHTIINIGIKPQKLLRNKSESDQDFYYVLDFSNIWGLRGYLNKNSEIFYECNVRSKDSTRSDDPGFSYKHIRSSKCELK